jgi:hypothetical protein
MLIHLCWILYKIKSDENELNKYILPHQEHVIVQVPKSHRSWLHSNFSLWNAYDHSHFSVNARRRTNVPDVLSFAGPNDADHYLAKVRKGLSVCKGASQIETQSQAAIRCRG